VNGHGVTTFEKQPDRSGQVALSCLKFRNLHYVMSLSRG
jgi:hypothetical protein